MNSCWRSLSGSCASGIPRRISRFYRKPRNKRRVIFRLKRRRAWTCRVLKKPIDRADIVLSGGGGLFQNATSLKSLLYYAGIVRAAIHAGRKAMVFAQSIGPLDFIGRQTVRECCKGLHAATVRDERSRVLLETLVSGVAVERSADPVFLIDPPGRQDAVSALGLDSDPLVVVCVRKTTAFTDGVEKIAAAVDRLADLGARVVFLPIGGIADAEASTAIIRRCRSTPMLLPMEWRGHGREIDRASGVW